ncbi:MAG: hypothetical protein H0V17_11810 [Deltaproteobacteria bacterium]|nr:hypothetical protein [Deltaproteobacteria bacterium]
MANPFALATAMARLARIKCPHCGFQKLVDRKSKAFRVCARCHKRFPDPLAAKMKKRL